MATIDVLPLKGYDRELEEQLGNEYKSAWGYHVSAEQKARGAIFTLVRAEYRNEFLWRDASTDSDIGWLSSIAEAGEMSFIARIGEEPAGVIICESQRWNNVAVIRYIYVKTGLRRRGVGAALMRVLEEAAREANLRGITLETQSKNGAALDYYRALGFDIVGINTRFYTNNDLKRGDVALFLHKPL